MSERIFLTVDQLSRVAEVFSLGSVLSHTDLLAGTINTNHKVVCDSGTYFVRVNEGKSREDVSYEAEVVTALHDRQVRTPLPLPVPEGSQVADIDGRLISVMPWIEGGHRDSTTVSVNEARRLGQSLGALHLAGAEIADRFANPSRYRTSEVARRLHTISYEPGTELANALTELRAERAWLEERRDARAALPSGVVHGDLFPDNVLFSEDGQVVALLDFEQAATGSFAYDLAVVLSSWCVTEGKLNSERARALLEGYESLRPRAPLELELLPTEGRAVAFRFAITRITDVHLLGLDRAGKDYRETMEWLYLWRTLQEAADRAGLSN